MNKMINQITYLHLFQKIYFLNDFCTCLSRTNNNFCPYCFVFRNLSKIFTNLLICVWKYQIFKFWKIDVGVINKIKRFINKMKNISLVLIMNPVIYGVNSLLDFDSFHLALRFGHIFKSFNGIYEMIIVWNSTFWRGFYLFKN